MDVFSKFTLLTLCSLQFRKETTSFLLTNPLSFKQLLSASSFCAHFREREDFVVLFVVLVKYQEVSDCDCSGSSFDVKDTI